MKSNKELIENAIKSKLFVRKDVVQGKIIDFPSVHGRLINYALDNDLKHSQNKIFADDKTSFITELTFDSEDKARFFYENMETIMDLTTY
jgi:hypothetical protein